MSNESFNKLLEEFTHTANGVMGVDAHQRIVLWNPAAEAQLGYKTQEVLGKCCYNIMKGRGCDAALVCSEHCTQFHQARKLQWSTEQLLEAETKNGKQVTLQVISLCVLSSKRKLSVLIHIFGRADESRRVSNPEDSLPPETVKQSLSLFLSSRELTILRCMTAGMDTKATAAHLFISPTTVRNHVQHILNKLGVHSRLEAVSMATGSWSGQNNPMPSFDHPQPRNT